MTALINQLRANIRLRIGLALIISIVAAYGLLEWRDLGQARLNEYRQLSGNVARLGNQQSLAQWPARAEQATAALVVAERRLWPNTSFGLAQAQVQDWLYALLRQADAKKFTVKLSDGEADFGTARAGEESAASMAGIKQMRARIEFNTEAPVLLALLAALNDAEHQVIVDTLNVKGPQTQLELSVWCDLRASSGAASAPLAARSHP